MTLRLSRNIVEYNNRVYVRGHKYVLGLTQTHSKMSLRRDPDSDLGCHCNTSWCVLFFSADFTRNQQWRTNFSRRWVKCGRSYEETQEYINLWADLKSYLWSLLYDASCKFHNMHCACCMMPFVPGRVFRMRYDEQYVCCVYNTICGMREALRTSCEMVFTRCVTRTALRLPCVFFPPKRSSSNLPS